MKRQSLLFFSWLLLATPAAVQAQFSYTVTNQTVTITGYTGTGGVVVIPSTINGLPVTSIGFAAFQYSSITGVTIPNSVTSIGDDVFWACTSLTSITIPNSVTSIGDDVFWVCTSLTSITIPNSVTTIGDGAFLYCTSLTNIAVDPLNSAFSSVDGVVFNQSQTTLVEYPGGKLGGYMIPNSVTSIADSAFAGCSSLTSVTIPNSVTSLGAGAFSGCFSLTNITLGSGVTSIGDYTFSIQVEGHYSGCPLMNITIPNSVTNIGMFAFASCTSLTTVTIPNSVTKIGDFAFYNCTSLTSVTIGNSVTNIGVSAFYYCSGLTSVTIPNSVTSLGDYAFGQCSNLTSVYFQGNAPSVGGTDLFFGDNVTLYYLPGTTGWSSTFAGFPTALWRLPYPIILTSNPSFGVRTNQFGFTVSWATNLNVVVETATDLAHPVWSLLQTNALTSGSFYFSDSQWTNNPSRFYRVRSQ